MENKISTFKYTATMPSGRPVRGQMSVKDEAELSANLKKKSLRLESCREIKRHKKSEAMIVRHISKNDLSAFYSFLLAQYQADVSILDALNDAETIIDNLKLKHVILDMISIVKDGFSLSSAMEAHSKVFEPHHSSLIAAGEQMGALEKALRMVVDDVNKEIVLKNKLSKSLRMPLVFLFLLGFMVFLVTQMIAPQINSFLLTSEVAAPFSTSTLLTFSTFISQNIVVLLSLFLIFLIVFIVPGKIVSKLKLEMPFLGELEYLRNHLRFYKTLYMLTSSDFEITRAVEKASKVGSNDYLKNKHVKLFQKMNKGYRLFEAMKLCKTFRDSDISLIEMFEHKGQYSEALRILSDQYENKLQQKMDNLFSYAEISTISVFSFLIFWITLALVSPIYTAIGNIYF